MEKVKLLGLAVGKGVACVSKLAAPRRFCKDFSKRALRRAESRISTRDFLNCFVEACYRGTRGRKACRLTLLSKARFGYSADVPFAMKSERGDFYFAFDFGF